MSVRYHINPETGRPNICRATIKCEFAVDGVEPEHYASKEEAREAIAKKAKEEAEGSSSTALGSVSKNSVKKATTNGRRNADNVKRSVSLTLENGMDAYDAPPVDFDAEYRMAMFEASKAEFDLASKEDRLLRQYGKPIYHRGQYTRKLVGFELSTKEAYSLAKQAGDSVASDYREAYGIHRESLKKIQQLDTVYSERGEWTRAFLVTNGHLHSNTECSTCHKGKQRTQFDLRAEYSGKSEEELVKAAGYRACTVCYPDAPVGDERSLPSVMLTEEEQKAKAEREKAKLERDAKKSEAQSKAPTVSGQPLTIKKRRYGETFKTERMAMQEAVNSVKKHNDAGYYGTEEGISEQREIRYAIAYSLAEKHDKSLKEIDDDIRTKAVAKAKRDAKEFNKYRKGMLKEIENWSEEDIKRNQDYYNNLQKEATPSEPVFHKFNIPDDLYEKPLSEWSDEERRTNYPAYIQ